VRFSRIAEGREFVMRVPGVSQSPLSDAEIAAVLNWMVRNLSDEALPSRFQNYTAEEVRSVRGIPLTQVRATRQKLLVGTH